MNTDLNKFLSNLEAASTTFKRTDLTKNYNLPVKETFTMEGRFEEENKNLVLELVDSFFILNRENYGISRFFHMDDPNPAKTCLFCLVFWRF